MALQPHPAPSAYEARVKAWAALHAAVDAAQPGPIKVEAQRLGNAWVNREIEEKADGRMGK
jgi:hypothetical protein